jgi:AraC family transcriptional regulator
MQEEKLQVSVSTPKKIAQLTGVSPIRLICSRTDEALAAALWRFPRSSRPLVIEDMPQSILACQWAGSPVKTKVSRGRKIRKQVKVGAVTFVPGDDRSEWWWDGLSETFAVYLGAHTIRSFAEEHVDGQPIPRIADFFAIEDPWLRGYFHMLVSEYELLFAGDSEADPLLLDHTRHVLIRHLMRWHSDAKEKRLAALDRRARVSPLPSAVVRRILDFVDANLTGDISLRTLADLAAMSVEHFLRSFHAATGKTPHRYVLEQRLHRAAAMLSGGRWPISLVCAECGFRSPKHFSQKFRSAFGIPPSIYRRQHCNVVPAFDPADERPHRMA